MTDWKFYAATALLIGALASSAQAAECYGTAEKVAAYRLWQDDEVRAWFQATPAARIIAETACGKFETVGAIDELTDRVLQSRLDGTEVPEQIEDASKRGIDYWRLFATLYREHAVKLPCFGQRERQVAATLLKDPWIAGEFRVDQVPQNEKRDLQQFCREMRIHEPRRAEIPAESPAAYIYDKATADHASYSGVLAAMTEQVLQGAVAASRQ